LKTSATIIEKPQRWDQPLDPQATDDIASKLMQVEPFASMDESAFSKNIPLRGILKNDCRLIEFNKGDIIVREGDYGSSAFLIVDGEALVSLKKIPQSVLGRDPVQPKSFFETIAQLWANSKHSEVRNFEAGGASKDEAVGQRVDDGQTRIFLHDIPRVIPAGQSVTLNKGEIFGEISALTRTPRSATVVASKTTYILEIRWQGFRELLKRNDAMRMHIESQYRENSLRSHLREIELLKDLPHSSIETISDLTVFESFGSFQWSQNFQSTKQKDIADRILSEPVIAQQGEYVDGLIMIRNGFARLSRSRGGGQQTIAYLGKGQTFGLRELNHNWQTAQQKPWTLSLRAVGYVDVLKIPTSAVEQHVLPQVNSEVLPPLFPEAETIATRRKITREKSLDENLMEFLVDRRYINGSQAMVIDLDRCTRCDDCVRACAATHDNNPRFVRHGEKHDHWMIANACMHCMDPVCMIGCPTGAIGRSEETGVVSINDGTCVGCSTCANSCPYDNIRMVEINNAKGLPILAADHQTPILKATKCDLCADQATGPACQNACPHDALVRIDLSTPADMITIANR
jgi:Fe-S-cluster-containing dehydrogenase component